MHYTYQPKTPTQKKTLENILTLLERDKSSLEGTYSSINISTELSLICYCGNPFEKQFKQLKETGAFCKTCIYRDALTKRIHTTKAKHGVDNISQLNSIKYKKKTTALSNGFIKSFPDWIEDIKAKGLYDYWDYLFDTIDGYDSPHPMRHKKCGTVVEKSPRSHLLQDSADTAGQGCLTCYRNSNRMTREEFKMLSIQKYGQDRFQGYESVPEIIPNNKTFFSLQCVDHGSFTTNYDTHLHGSGGCVPCSCNQKTVKTILEEFGEILRQNGVELILDGYAETDILVLSQHYPARCIKNNSHPNWNPILSNLTKHGTGCPHCTRGRHYSKPEIEWLVLNKVTNPSLRHALSTEGQFRIGEKKLNVDGAVEDTKLAFEFHGCYFHGCKKCFKDRKAFNTRVKKTYDELYASTLEKKAYIESCGFRCIEMWECEWNRFKKAVITLQRLWLSRSKSD